MMQDKTAQSQEVTAGRVQKVLETLLRNANLAGEIVVFGSFSNGFKTGGSDLDVVLVTKQTSQSDAVTTLNKIAGMAPKYNFINVTKIFQANVPILKFTDASDGMEIDFCINNHLGIRNSLLLQAYCRLDPRISQLGRMVKMWAKGHEIVGTADGCPNTYAYMLLVIYYLQVGCNPPVSVNLQSLYEGEPHKVLDYKWGADGGDAWDTQFVSDVGSVPPTKNKDSLDTLLRGFFHFYSTQFDWKKDAVCMRLAPNAHVPKTSLICFIQSASTDPEQWCCEDPFDLKHNLAGKCTTSGKKRIMDEMANALQNLSKGNTDAVTKPAAKSPFYYLKCRVSGAVTPHAMLEEFEAYNINALFFPKTDAKTRFQQAFLEFTTNEARRKAHTKNETYVADCQLQMHYTSQSALNDILATTQYSKYDMASYKAQRQLLEVGTDTRKPNPTAAPFFPGIPYGVHAHGLGRQWEYEEPRRDEMMPVGMEMEMEGRRVLLHRTPPQGEYMDSMMSKGGGPLRRDNQMSMMEAMRGNSGLQRKGGPVLVSQDGRRISPMSDQWGPVSANDSSRGRQGMEWILQQQIHGRSQTSAASTAVPQKGKMEQNSVPFPTMSKAADGTWNHAKMGVLQPGTMPMYPLPMHGRPSTPPWSPRDEEERGKGSPPFRYAAFQPPGHVDASAFSIDVDIKIPESMRWREVPLVAVADQETTPGQRIEGRIFSPSVIESLRAFYGSFKNDEYDKWKQATTAR